MANYGGEDTLSTRNIGSRPGRVREHETRLTWMDRMDRIKAEKPKLKQ